MGRSDVNDDGVGITVARLGSQETSLMARP